MDHNPNAFKHSLGKEAIRRIARNIKGAEPSFPAPAFIRSASKGIEALELKARVMHLVEALRRHLPAEIPAAIALLIRAGDAWDAGDPEDNTSGFAAWPVIEFVGEHGLDHFDLSMEALRRLTRLFSAEFAVRGFIERDQNRALERLASWIEDPDPRVRRLVSEGTRPRLPWGRRLRKFQQDPRPVLKLLERLRDDPAEVVRRSVANNLNDIAKDHRDAVIKVCRRWAKGASAERRWIIEHATRTLVKEGHPEALELLGFDPRAKLTLESITLAPRRISLGEEITFSFELHSRSRQPQPLVIDFALHHVKQAGTRTAKVFKLKQLVLGPRETLTISKRHRIKAITTRRYYSGAHAIEILINGRPRAMEEFHLSV